MSADFTLALNAAQAAAAAQHYPQGTLYMVATPIGNLADIGLRALHVLGLCDTVACEDTRHSQGLLRSYGLDSGQRTWLALHQHNEAEATQEVLRRLQAGQRVAYLSDAGTPAVSDPGARLAWQVQAAGLRVMPLPGASSVTALLSAAGSPAPEQGGFVFLGFLPARANEREACLSQIASESRTQVLLEAPHRIEALATLLARLGARPVGVGRELTKQFEEVATMPAQAMPGWLQAHPQRCKGEFVVVVHAQAPTRDDTQAHDRLLHLLLQELPLKTAVKLAAEISGAARNAWYERALQLRATPSDSEGT